MKQYYENCKKKNKNKKLNQVEQEQGQKNCWLPTHKGLLTTRTSVW